MKRLAGSALAIAATLLEFSAALLWLARDVLAWAPPPSDPFGEWAEQDGAAALRALAGGESGRL